MPKRPRSHQIEDEQRRAFERLIGNWVNREERSDYGVDGEVEVFEGGSATGLSFRVQLKATDEDSLKKALKIRVDLEKVNYYKKMDLPVLIVRYHSPSGTTFAKWFGSFRIMNLKDDQKTVTLTLSEQDEWTDETPDRIVAELRMRKRLRTPSHLDTVRIRVEVDREWSQISAQRIRLAIRRRCDLAGRLFRISDDPRQPSEIRAEVGSTGVVVWAGMERSAGLTLRGLEPDNIDLETFADDVMVLIAFLLGKLGHYGLTARIIAASTGDAPSLRDPERAGEIAGMIAATGDTGAALDLVERHLALAEQSPISPQVIAHMLSRFSARTEATAVAVEMFLKRRLESPPASASSRDTATIHYSLGNIIRRSNPRVALRQYRLAARKDPGYRSRSYWWEELGGLVFNANQDRSSVLWYRVAAGLYRKALALGAEGECIVAYGDALQFSGEYEGAESQFSRFLRSEQSVRPIWILKYRALLYLRETTGLVSQTRFPFIANGLAGQAVERGEVNEDVLQSDALCVHHWFNLGISALKSSNYSHAFFRFLITAVTEERDVEAWCYAVVTAALAGEEFHELTFLAVLTACQEHGDSFVESMYQFVQAGTWEHSEKNC